LFLLIILPFPPQRAMVIFSAILMTIIFITALVRNWIPLPNLLAACVLTIILINIWLDTGFYPRLLDFQMSIPVSRYINENHLDKDRIFLFQMNPPRSLDFYSNHSFQITTRPDSLQHEDFLLTTLKGKDMLDSNNYIIIDSGYAFRVSMLSMHVLNPRTRVANSEGYYLLKHR